MNSQTEIVVAELAELGARTGILASRARKHICSNSTRFRIQQMTSANQAILAAVHHKTSKPSADRPVNFRTRVSNWLVSIKASLAPQPEQVYLTAMSDCQRRFRFLVRLALEQPDLSAENQADARVVIERSLGRLSQTRLH